MNLWDCIIDCADETEIGTPSSTTKPTITELVRWANKAQDIVASETGCIDKLLTWSTVAKQYEYSLPAEFVAPRRAEYMQSTSSLYRLNYADISEFQKNSAWNMSTGTPEMYTIWDNKFRIFPPVSSSAGNSKISAALTFSASTVDFDSVSGFPTRGRAIIDSEVIEYTGTSGSTVSGITRGVEGTTAAAHSSGATVYERDLCLWSKVRYKERPLAVYTVGTASLTSGSSAVAAGSTAPYWWGNVFAGQYIGAGTNPSKWYKITSVNSVPALVIDSLYAEANSANTAYTIVSGLDIPQEFSDLLSQYMVSRTWAKLEETEKSEMAKRNFYGMVSACRARSVDRGDIYPVADLSGEDY